MATIIDEVAIDNGLGRHTFYLTHEQLVKQRYYSLLAQVFCVHALGFAKLSIVISYMRVLRGSGSQLHQIILWTIGILVMAINLVAVISFYIACIPSQKAWDPLVDGACWTINTQLVFYLLQGGVLSIHCQVQTIDSKSICF